MNKKQSFSAILFSATLAIALLTSNVALAAPVTWTLNNWGLLGGGSATGSFVYDAGLGSYSNVSITSTIGVAGSTFSFDGVDAAANKLQFVFGDPSSDDLTGTAVLLGTLGNPGMTDAGGTLFILTQGGENPDSSQSICANANCSSSDSPIFLTSGTISGSPVPVPAAVWLFGSALGFLGWMRRKAA
jgi:hypothetical protein